MASYKVVIKRSAAKEIEAVGRKKTRQRIVARTREVAADPRFHGCEKLSSRHDRYRTRQGSFRIVYEIQDEILVVYVVKVADRKDVCR